MKGPGRWAMRPTLVPMALALDAVFQQLTDDTGKPCPTPTRPHTRVQSGRPAPREGTSHLSAGHRAGQAAGPLRPRGR